MTDIIRLYHGTSLKNTVEIMNNGANQLYLTLDEEQAYYYAEQASDEDGTEKSIVVVEIPTNMLKADLCSFDEPLSYILEYHSMIEDEWHEAINNGTIAYPDANDWKTSLRYTKNVIAFGDIKKEFILGENLILTDEDELKIQNIINYKTILNKKNK